MGLQSSLGGMSDVYNCGKKGHLAENCPEPKKCSHCGKKSHLAKDCREKHPERKPTAKTKAKAQPTKPGGRGKSGGKGGRKTKGRGKRTSFEELMGKKNKMTKNMMTNMKRKTRVKITQNQKLTQVLEDLSSRFMSRLPCA